MHVHSCQVWSGLRAVLLAASEPGISPGEDLEDRKSLAAASCLASCLAALGPGTLDALALKDLEVGGELRRLLTADGGDSAAGGRTSEGLGVAGVRRSRDASGDRAAMCAAATMAAVSVVYKDPDHTLDRLSWRSVKARGTVSWLQSPLTTPFDIRLP